MTVVRVVWQSCVKAKKSGELFTEAGNQERGHWTGERRGRGRERETRVV